MRSLDELVSSDKTMIEAIHRHVERAESPCTILAPTGDRERALLAVQAGTELALGAIAYETGGILVDHGWLRFLGCGHAELPRNLADWNSDRAAGLCLVADDIVGGFFAVNTGAFGNDPDMYYWAPDNLRWEPIGFEFDFFFRWSLTAALGDFYQHLRWSNWAHEVADVLPADHCFLFDPPLWTSDASVAGGQRRTVPVAELFALKQAAWEEADS